MSEPILVICTQTERPAGVKNCRQTDCAKCGAELWISPSTLRTLVGQVFEPLCQQCALETITAEAEFMGVSEHQLAEMPAEKRAAFLNQSPS